MAVIHPDDASILKVFANQSGTITIEQIDRGGEGCVVVDPKDVDELAHALLAVAQEIERGDDSGPAEGAP